MTKVSTKTQSYPALKRGFWGGKGASVFGQITQNVESNSLGPLIKN